MQTAVCHNSDAVTLQLRRLPRGVVYRLSAKTHPDAVLRERKMSCLSAASLQSMGTLPPLQSKQIAARGFPYLGIILGVCTSVIATATAPQNARVAALLWIPLLLAFPGGELLAFPPYEFITATRRHWGAVVVGSWWLVVCKYQVLPTYSYSIMRIIHGMPRVQPEHVGRGRRGGNLARLP